jgi:hypothetical protein
LEAVVAKTKTTEAQIAFDFGDNIARPKRRALAKRPKSQHQIEILPPVTTEAHSRVETVQPVVERQSPAQRETEAFRLYQAQLRHTVAVCLSTVVLAVVLLAVQFLGAGVIEASPVGLKVTFENKRVLLGILGWVTLGSALWSLYSVYCTRALWHKCGFFYQSIMRPTDSHAILLLIRSAVVVVLGSLALIICVVVGYSLPDMYGVVRILVRTIMLLPTGTWDPVVCRS